MQFLKDLLLRLQSDRKTQLLAVAGLVIAGYLLVSNNTAVRRAPKAKPQPQAGAPDADERWKDIFERYNTTLNTLSKDMEENKTRWKETEKRQTENEILTGEILKKIIAQMGDLQKSVGSAQQPGAQPITVTDPSGPDILPVQSEELENIGGQDVAQTWPTPGAATPRLAAIMPGDSVKVKLLAGVNAPTDGTPYPVVLKLIGSVLGPDGNNIPLGEARLIAAAQGSLTDSRVLLRLTKLSLRLPNGRRKEFPVDGWVVGEDGLRGMEGVLIDPIGKAIGGSMMAGGLAGAGEGLALANTDTLTYSTGAQSRTVDSGNIPEYAAGNAASAGAREWSRIIQDRLSQLVPHVQVLSGREVTAVFSESFAIPDLLEQVDEDPSVVFTSLD